MLLLLLSSFTLVITSKVDKLAFFIDMLPRLGIAKPELVQEVRACNRK